MKYSIIIPCYKVEQFLSQCINSVLAQTDKDFEIILVDDGSPDRSGEICDEYAEKDKRIKVIHKSNGGASDARNAGLDVAQGEYVMFLDSDDWWDDKDALRKIDASIIESGSDITIIGMKKYFSQEGRYGDVRIPLKCYKERSALSPTQVLQQYMHSNIFVACAWDKVVRRSLIEKDHQRFVKHQLGEDIEWCCKLLLKNPKIEVLEEAFYVYRQQVATSLTANVSIKNITCILDVICRYAKQDAPEPLLHFIANQYVLLITNFMRLSKEDQRPLEDDVRKLWWLIRYDWYPYTRLVSKIKFLGYSITKFLLRIYYKQKHK